MISQKQPGVKTATQYSIILFCLLLNFTSNAQDVYVTSPVNVPLGNKTYVINLSNCNTQEVPSCAATNNIDQFPENQFTDIAIDGEENLYWVSGWGSLYRRKLCDAMSCQFLGVFDKGNSINALVADSAAILYAAGNSGGVSVLYKYEGGVFKKLGDLPAGIFSAGDLLFYEHRLFLTATNASLSHSFLVEVNTTTPELSCVYMDLGNYQPYGAFCIHTGSSSKAYIICLDNPSSSSLREVDIPNKFVSDIICSYPFLINGAAAFYAQTSNNTICTQNPTNTDGSCINELSRPEIG